MNKSLDTRHFMQIIKNLNNEYKMLNEETKREVSKVEKKNDEDGFRNSTGEPVETIFFEIFPDNVVWRFAVPRVNLIVTYSLEADDSIFIEIINPQRQDSVSGTDEKVKGSIQLDENMLNVFKGIRTYYDTFEKNWMPELNGDEKTSETPTT